MTGRMKPARRAGLCSEYLSNEMRERPYVQDVIEQLG